MIGRSERLEPLFQNRVRVAKPHLPSEDAVWTEVRNDSDQDVVLKRVGAAESAEIRLSARSTIIARIGTIAPHRPTALSCKASPLLIAPGTALEVKLEMPAP